MQQARIQAVPDIGQDPQRQLPLVVPREAGPTAPGRSGRLRQVLRRVRFVPVAAA